MNISAYCGHARMFMLRDPHKYHTVHIPVHTRTQSVYVHMRYELFYLCFTVIYSKPKGIGTVW